MASPVSRMLTVTTGAIIGGKINLTRSSVRQQGAFFRQGNLFSLLRILQKKWDRSNKRKERKIDIVEDSYYLA
ncbi:hypothetical protein CJP72_23795 [Citrobacter sp. NCU1]|nr:hypothetical protein [Citrobacter sp. NCU1]